MADRVAVSFPSSSLTTGARAARGGAPRLALAFVIAFLVTALPVGVHLIAQPLAIVVCVALSFGATLLLEGYAPVVVLTANIFQNIFIALASSQFTDAADVERMKSYSFIATVAAWAAMAAIFLRDRSSYSPFVRRLIYASTALLAVFGVYFVLGVGLNERSAIVYLRNYSMPLLLFQTFLIIAARYRVPLLQIVSALLVLLGVCGYLELLSTETWLNLVNGWHYYDLAYTQLLPAMQDFENKAHSGNVITGVLDLMTSTLLNTSLLSDLDIKLHRLQGPNFHPISFGYLLATLIAFAAVHKRAAIAVAMIPLLILTNAKGPLLLAFGSIAFSIVARFEIGRFAPIVLLGALAVFAALAFELGLGDGDYHVLGLLGGMHGFLQNPLGHSLGQGGNLSVADFAAIDWEKYQHEGAADIAVESAVGVVLFQLGVAAAAAFAFYGWVSRTSWRLYRMTRAPALSFATAAILITLVNGLFQEEAYFAPLALGLIMALVGLSLGATDRALALARMQRSEEFTSEDSESPFAPASVESSARQGAGGALFRRRARRDRPSES